MTDPETWGRVCIQNDSPSHTSCQDQTETCRLSKITHSSSFNPTTLFPSSHVLMTCSLGLITSQQSMVEAPGRAGYSVRLKRQSLPLSRMSALACEFTCTLACGLEPQESSQAHLDSCDHKEQSQIRVHSNCLWPLIWEPNSRVKPPSGCHCLWQTQ